MTRYSTFMQILLLTIIAWLTLSCHVTAEHTYPALATADVTNNEASSITHPPLPTNYPPLPTETTTTATQDDVEMNEQYNTTATSAPVQKQQQQPQQPELSPSATLASRSPDEIAWATVVYDSASSTGSLSVVNNNHPNGTHPYVHVRNDELHGQYGASSNPALLRDTAEYEKQKAAKEAAIKQEKHVIGDELTVLAEQYGVPSTQKKPISEEQSDIHSMMEDETNHRVSIETTLIANGTWVLPNIVEKDAAKWTDSAYGSTPADAITATSEIDDSPLQSILKDEATRAAAAAAVSEIVSLEALELAELASRAELERSTLQSFEESQKDATRAANIELMDEILRENEYVRHSRQQIEKQLLREKQLREKQLHELDERNHQHIIGDHHITYADAPQDDMHGQYGIIANPDVISAQAEDAEIAAAAMEPVHTTPPPDHGVEYGDKAIPTQPIQTLDEPTEPTESNVEIVSQDVPVELTPAPVDVQQPMDMNPTPGVDDTPAVSFALKDIHALAQEADIQASSDPFSDIPSFSLAQHLQQLINQDELDFIALTSTATHAPPTTPCPTVPPPPPYGGGGHHGYSPIYTPDISAMEIPAPTTARLYFNYAGLQPNTPRTPAVNVSLIATTFRIKCVPSNTKGGTLVTITADGLSSPIDVTGLDGTVSYTCTAGVITPAYGLQWGKSWKNPIQTGQQRVTLRLNIPYTQTCGSPHVNHFYYMYRASLAKSMGISESEIKIVSCLRDYAGMTLITIAFTFPSQYVEQSQNVRRVRVMSTDTTTTPTTLSASEKRDLLQNLIANPDSVLYKDVTSYTYTIDSSYWSAEQRDLGRDVCDTSAACSGNDYCYNGYETTYQCQCDSSQSSRNCWNKRISCTAPACISGHHISSNTKPLPDCAVFTIAVALNLHVAVANISDQADMAQDIISMLSDATLQDPSVFQFMGFSTNTDGTARAEINILQNGNRSTACIIQDLQYQGQDIRTAFMRAMDSSVGGLETVLKQCDDGTYAQTCNVGTQPWYIFWIYMVAIVVGTIFCIILLYLCALRMCIHIFPEPMAAFLSRHRLPGINEKKLEARREAKAARRKAEALANGISYDMNDVADSCVESDFHGDTSTDEYPSKNKNKQNKIKIGEIATIDNGSYRPESARTEAKSTSVEPVLPTVADASKPKRFALWKQKSTTSTVPVDHTGIITTAPTRNMHVMDLSVPSDPKPQQPTTQTTTVRTGFFGRKIITTRRASGFKMPEFSVTPLDMDTTTFDEPLQTRSMVGGGSMTLPEVSRVGPQSTAWLEGPRNPNASVSHRSAPSSARGVVDPRIYSAPRSELSQALSYAQSQLHDDIETIDTTPIPTPIRAQTLPNPPSIRTSRSTPEGLHRRASSINMIGHVYVSDSDHEAIRPPRTTTSTLTLPTRESSVNRISPRSYHESLPNGYNSGMESPGETTEYEYPTHRSEYSHL